MFVNIKGVRIHYLVQGKGEDAIFITGVFGDIKRYKGIIDILSKKYKVWAFDLPMHGKSGKLKEDFSLDGLVNLTKDFVKLLKIKNPTLFTHSAGGLIAIKYASKNPTKKIVLMNAAVLKVDRSKVSPKEMAFGTIRAFLKSKGHFWNLLIVMFFGTYNYAKNIFNKDFQKLFKNCLDQDLTDDIEKIKCPIIFLWGRDDALLNEDYVKAMKDLSKKGEIIWLESNHDWPLFEPERTIKYLPKLA